MTRHAAPELSVVLVSYRCAGHLRQCLAGLHANRADVDLEVLVIDNASGDSTPDVAATAPGVTLVRRPTNDGFAVAANVGLRRARGGAVLVLNPDTVVPRGTLRACLDELWAHPEVGVLTPRVLDATGRLDPRCHRGFPTAWSSFCFLSRLDRLLPGPATGGYLKRYLPESEPADVDAVSGAFMLMPMHALRQVGGFDQQFFMYAEDIDLCVRFRHAGFTVRYWPGAHVVHVGGGSSPDGRRSAAANDAAFRTVSTLIAKHRTGPAGRAFALGAWAGGELLLGISRARHLLRR